MSNLQHRTNQRPNLIIFVTICVLSLLLGLFIFVHQIKDINIYSDYLNTYGKAPPNVFRSGSIGQDLVTNKDENDSDSFGSTSSLKIEHKVKAVSILGERNSGTNWIHE